MNKIPLKVTFKQLPHRPHTPGLLVCYTSGINKQLYTFSELLDVLLDYHTFFLSNLPGLNMFKNY